MESISQPLADILEFARWAPSGDNTQPWRFEIINDHSLIIHGFDTRDHCVYDLDGHSSQLALGALQETLSIAAGAYGLRVEFRLCRKSPETAPDFFVELIPDSGLQPDPLLDVIKHRSVQRRLMQMTSLTEKQKQALEDVVGEFYTLHWFEKSIERWHLARLIFNNAKLRLILPEAYVVHRDIIEWDACFSENKVPDRALGLDSMTLMLMRWVMASWQRVDFFNTFLAGHLIPRIEMDLLPGLFCGAHFALVAQTAPQTIEDYVTAGRAIQRFWLTTTHLGLQLQPEMTPLIFSRYIRENRVFSRLPHATNKAAALADRLSGFMQKTPLENVVFLGRIGKGTVPVSRSLRYPLKRLLKEH